MGTFESSQKPRSLADDFRMRTDEELAHLLRHRSDLMNPPPAGISELAVNASSASSIADAIASLNSPELAIAEVIAALPDGTDANSIHAALKRTPGYEQVPVTHAIQSLWKLGILWGSHNAVHLVRSAREFFGGYPCGLAPELVNTRLSLRKFVEDESLIFELLDNAPVGVREIIADMLWTNPRGSYPNALKRIPSKNPQSPVEWLLVNELLIATDESTVVLPREVALPIRQHQLLKELDCQPPAISIDTSTSTQRDADGIHRALEFIQSVELAMNAIDRHSLSTLKAGGISHREFDRLRSTVPVSRETLALSLELAFHAGFLSFDELSGWSITTKFQDWLTHEDATRWNTLVSIWRNSMQTSRLGSDEKVRVLQSSPANTSEFEWKRTLLEAITTIAPGEKIDHENFVKFIQWQRPRAFNTSKLSLASEFLADLELLGVTYLQTMTESGFQSLTDAFDTETFTNNMPSHVDYIIVQADLTALSPGRLPIEHRQFLQRIAEIESASVATTYRFTPGSILHGIETGLSADEILKGITQLSKTPIPQPLEYLIQDVARRYGMLTAGVASMYLRCDNIDLLKIIQADRKLGSSKLRKIADNILISDEPLEVVIHHLRAAGYATAIDKTDRLVSVSKPPQPQQAIQRQPQFAVMPSERLIQSIIKSLRPASPIPTHFKPAHHGSAITSSTSETLVKLLQTSLEAGSAIWIGYADKNGYTTEHTVEPLAIEGGTMTAFELETNQVRTFTVARITHVQQAQEAEPLREEGTAS